MSQRKALWMTLFILSLPLWLAVIEAMAFQIKNRNNRFLESSGVERQYLLSVPASYDASRPTPLVISLHGGAGWPVLQREVSGWDELSERHGFLVAYPAGLDVGGMTGWQAIRPGPEVAEDVLFISELIDDVQKSYTLDPSRIYANGHSNGGSMSWVLSCALSDRIAAVGLVAAAHTLPWSWCSDAPPMPMIAFHGTADTAAPYAGGDSWVSPNTLPDIPALTAKWAHRNQCRLEPSDTRLASDVTRRSYTQCVGDAHVELYTIEDGGHTWPGSKALPDWFIGSTTDSIDASALMWTFFSEHQVSENPPLP